MCTLAPGMRGLHREPQAQELESVSRQRSVCSARIGIKNLRRAGTIDELALFVLQFNPLPPPGNWPYGRKWKIAPICPGSLPVTIPVFLPVEGVTGRV